MATVVGAALACAETFTESPSTTVTVSGAPVDPSSARTWYPCVVHVDVPPFVTVMNPVMVPAAPCPWDATAVILLHPEAAAVLDVVEELADDDVVGADELVVVARCAVVVVDRRVGKPRGPSRHPPSAPAPGGAGSRLEVLRPDRIEELSELADQLVRRVVLFVLRVEGQDDPFGLHQLV